MVRKKVFIRADADTQIGFGHFIRCLALADMLSQDFDCTLYTQQPTRYQIDEVEKVCSLRILPADNSKFQVFLDALQGEEIVVLDNYFFSSEYQKAIKDKGCLLVCLGSNDRHYYADALINFTDLPVESFSIEPYTRLCLGLDWTILRKAFYQKVRNCSETSSVAICIGGTDQFCYAEKFSASIRKDYPEIDIIIVSTDRIGENRIYDLRHSGFDVRINLNAEQMATVFRETQIALVSASGVAVEALSQGCNVIAGYYVDNQVNIYNTLAKNNYIWAIGNFADENVLQHITMSINNINKGLRKRPFNAENTITRYIELFKTL